jgi:hypothetical protein
MMAAASLARSISAPIALAIGGFTCGFDGGLDVPEDVPGVEAGEADGVMEGCPSPGVRFVEQPKPARRMMSAAGRNRPVAGDVFVRIRPPCFAVI